MSYKYILFDLDGTLTDPKEGITNSVAYSLKNYGIEVEDKDKLCPFIGPPLKESFKKFYGFSDEKAEEAVWRYREYFRPHGIYENKVYDGIDTLLSRLKESGKVLLLATSKPIGFANEILRHFNLAKYFDYTVGSELDGKRVEKADVIEYAISLLGEGLEKNELVMVGDRCFDVEGAHSFGIKCIGVLYGYGSYDELTKAGADFIVESVEELGQMLL